jgi:1-acyl-sn-glycerol-3-phosphate acyltransferase
MEWQACQLGPRKPEQTSSMNSSVSIVRLRLAALWVAVLGCAVAENAVRTYAIIQIARGWHELSLGLMVILLGMTAAPAFALAPLMGAISCSRGRWQVMVLATAAGLGSVAWSTFEEYRVGQTFWPSCFGVMALESALFAICCFAIIPEAARTARLSLPQLNGLFVLAVSAGTFGGVWIGIEQFPDGRHGMPIPLQVGHIGYGLALLAIVFARFPQPQPVRFNDGLIMPFLRTAGAIFRDRRGRNALLALWGLFAIGLGVTQWLMPAEPSVRNGFSIALIIGVVVGGLHSHPFRTSGVVPFGVTGLLACAIWAIVSGNWGSPALGFGGCLGLMAGPLLTIYQIRQSDDHRGHGGALLLAGWAIITAAFLVLLSLWMSNLPASKPFVGIVVFGLCAIGAIVSWIEFFRPAMELLMEWILWPMYRITATGPGLHLMPLKGPVLVIANHAAWFDPLWLDKIVPFPSTPMMTSKFFDLPLIGWFVRKVMGAVRVPDVVMRKNAPEIADVIAALDRDECVSVFPEGWLRRKEEQEMRRFGRGIWQILKARPFVPVFACWIEGGWGSFVSHRNGPPMTNKKIDFRRPITIAVLEPFTIDAATLETHMATRTALMKKVLEARAVFGLPPYDPFKLPVREEEDSDKLPEATNEGAT